MRQRRSAMLFWNPIGLHLPHRHPSYGLRGRISRFRSFRSLPGRMCGSISKRHVARYRLVQNLLKPRLGARWRGVECCHQFAMRRCTRVQATHAKHPVRTVHSKISRGLPWGLCAEKTGARCLRKERRTAEEGCGLRAESGVSETMKDSHIDASNWICSVMHSSTACKIFLALSVSMS